jgi:hypothetical protein
MDAYLVLLRVGFTVPVCYQTRGALLPHRFTLTTHAREGHRSAVCSLLHFPSAHAAQALPGTLPCGARTFLPYLTNCLKRFGQLSRQHDTTLPPNNSHHVVKTLDDAMRRLVEH